MAADLEQLHLAELHDRARSAGIEGYRRLRREELVERLSATPGAGDDAPEDDDDADVEERPKRRRRGRRGGRRGRERAERPAQDEPDTDEMVVVEATVLDDGAEKPAAESRDDGPTEEVSGILDLTRQRYGFLRLTGLEPSEGDVYISAAQVRRCELRPGDEVAGPAREPRRGERHRALVHVDSVNGEDPHTEVRPEFDSLPAVLPERRIPLDDAADDVLVRAVDLLAPLAFGQRVLVRATARSGRTTLLRSLARAAAATENARVIVLLVDERPEEATAWREALPVAEFAIATAEMASADQLRTAELALERGRRLAETGTDAVLVCDSLSRLAFAAGDVSEVKRLFGSGRNLAGGGSLTVIATTVADGQDDGEAERAVATTESSLVVMDPELAAAGVIPALRAGETRTSNEDQLREPAELEATRRLRSLVVDLKPSDAAALLRERIEDTPSNAELLASL
jgi:transcription termination factor Rho